MVYITYKCYNTDLRCRKLDIQVNISERKGTQKTASYLTAPSKKEDVTSPWRVRETPLPLSGRLFLAFGGTGLHRANGISLLCKLY